MLPEEPTTASSSNKAGNDQGWPDLSFEKRLWRAGAHWIAGIDEAGRGAWAGPVYAGAVVLDPRRRNAVLLKGVRDSKLMTQAQREFWALKIKRVSAAWAVACASAAEIDELGILVATRLAMLRAVEALALASEHLMIDAVCLHDCQLPQTILIHGDNRSLSIAAASVLAKTARDTIMCAMDSEHPGYGFARHKGYGTTYHQLAIAVLGSCAQHRLSYRPFCQT